MNILLTNDDGIHAPGLITLAEHLATIADITVIAPDKDRSASSSALTLDNPIRVKKIKDG